MKRLRVLLMLGLLAVAGYAPRALAACQSAASGSWNTGSTWTGCAGTGGIPAATDAVTINAHHLITIDANASARSFSLTASTAPANGITINVGNSLILTNDCTLNGGTTAGSTQTVSIGAGTLQCGSLSIVGSAGAGSLVSVSSGTLTTTIAGSPATTGTITFSGTAANAGLTSTGASAINISGNLTSGGTLTTSNTGTITFNGSAAQTMGTYTTYNKIVVNKSAGTLTTSGTTTITGSLTLTAGTIAIAGTTTIVGLLTINSGATWSNTSSAVTFEGGITNNGTFTGGTGAQAFTTNSQTLSGSGLLLCSGAVNVVGAITVTNNTTVNAVNLSGGVSAGTAGTWVQGANSSLFVSGTVFSPVAPNFAVPPTLNASASGNIVTYNGAAQTVIAAAPVTYFNLSLTGSGSKTIGTATGQTLTVAGNLGLLNGVTFLGSTFNPTVKITGSVTNLGTITTGNGTYTIGGNFSNSNLLGGGVTTTGTSTFSLAGNFSNVGTFTTSTGAIIFNGTTAQTFTGSNAAGSTTFSNMTLINATGLTMIGTHNMLVGTPFPISGTTCAGAVTVAPVLTLTKGQITTGSNILTIVNGSSITGAGVTDSTSGVTAFINGNLTKPFANGVSVSRTFEVGTGNSYAPFATVLACVNGSATMVTVNTTGQDHPQIATSTIDSYQSVNRYWTIAVVPSSATWFTPAAGDKFAFAYVAGDLDPAPTNPSSFVLDAYHGASGWTQFTPSSANSTSTILTGTGITPANLAAAYQIGDPGLSISPASVFNAFESLPFTPAGAINGRIYTKLAGTAFNLDIVAINAGAQEATFTGNVSVSLVANTTASILGANNCPALSSTIQGPFSVAIAGGRATVPFAAVTNAYRDVRVMIQYSALGITTCSVDDFAIRPTGFVLSSVAAANTSTSSAPTVKAGASFDLVATSVAGGAGIAGYDSAPVLDTTTLGILTGSPTAGILNGNFNAPPIVSGTSTGVATGTNFTYTEVGNFGLGVNAVYDSSFTGVDQTAQADCTSDFSNILVNGMYGCSFGSAAIPVPPPPTMPPTPPSPNGFGRFIPDHFDVSVSTAPALTAACSSFTYVGQPFYYAAAPVLTVTARNLGNTTTTNYAGVYMNLTPGSLAQGMYASQGGRYTSFDVLGSATPAHTTPALDLTALPSTTVDPTISFPAASSSSGVGTLTFAGSAIGAGFNFTRNNGAPNVPFAASIAFTLNIVDTDAVAYAGNPFSFTMQPQTATNGITFSGSNNFYYGRLRVANANGSELLTLLAGVQAQYYVPAGTTSGVFVTNTSDNCTPVSAVNIGRGNFPPGNLTAALTTPTIVKTNGVTPTGVLSAGQAAIRFPAPGAGKNGAMDIVLNLENAPGPFTCVAISGVATTPGANLLYLQDAQSCSSGQYTKDPTAHITFGVYNLNPNSIYLRENY